MNEADKKVVLLVILLSILAGVLIGLVTFLLYSQELQAL